MSNEKLILHVDDDTDDILLIGEELKAVDESLNIVGASNGHEAINFLEQTSQLPHLIILDINMPGMDGRETLSVLKQHEQWKSIPVVMLSTSSNPRDKEYCNSFQVDFLTKPMEIAELRNTAKVLLNYSSK